jgi:hypothetical protein
VIPAFTLGEDDRDVERRVAHHLSRKGVLSLVCAVAAVLLFCYLFIFPSCKAQRDIVVSQENLRSIHGAAMLYASDNNDGLPPAYERIAADTPLLDSKRRPVTWAALAMGYIDGTRLTNPASRAAWSVEVSDVRPDRKGQLVRLDYGLAAPLDAARTYDIGNRSAVLFAETISSGASYSLDPFPLSCDRDGFLIGFADGNYPGPPSREARYATRLAFTAPDKTDNPGAMDALHGDRGTLAVSVDGGILSLLPTDQLLPRVGTLSRWNPNR